MRIIILTTALFMSLVYASEPVVDFNKKWEYSRLEFKKSKDGIYGTKFFTRYMRAGKKQWPIAELIYLQKDNNSKKVDLNTLIEKKKKLFNGVDWRKEERGKTIIQRGFSTKTNRFVEIYAWPRGHNGYGLSISLSRRGYFKSINRELTYVNESLQDPNSKISSIFNLIIDTAYAQDALDGSNMIFDEAMVRTALRSNQIPVLTKTGEIILVSKTWASSNQTAIFESVKKEYFELLDERERYLKEQEKIAKKQQRELDAQAQEAASLKIQQEEIAAELAELEARDTIFDNYKIYEDKLKQEKIKIMNLELMADEALLILEEIESKDNSSATVEDLILKYSDITGRDANLDCIECSVEQEELFPTGFMNRVLNFINKARRKGRDLPMEFCKQYEQIIRALINLEHFNQEARSIILLSEYEVYARLEEEIKERQARYDQLNSKEAAKKRQQILTSIYKTVNRADREWMRKNRKPFMEDCKAEKYSEYDGDDPLMKTSYELAKEIVASHNPIKNVGDFFFNFFCFNEACKIRRACRQVYREALMEPMEKPKKEVYDLAPDALIMQQQLFDATEYFQGIHDQMTCYSHLRITYDISDFSAPRHMTDPSSIPECAKEGAEDAVNLYNLKKKLLSKFNELECPQKMDSFYQGLSTSGLIFPESEEEVKDN